MIKTIAKIAAPAEKVTAEEVEELVIETVKATALTEDKLPTTAKEINTLFASAVTHVNNANAIIQIAACAAIVHLVKHGDIRIIRNQLNNMPTSMRRNALAAFFDAYAPVMFADDGAVALDKQRLKTWKQQGIAPALAQPWHTINKEAEYKPFDFYVELNKLIERAEKRLGKADVDKGDKVSAVDIAKAKALLPVQTEAKAA